MCEIPNTGLDANRPGTRPPMGFLLWLIAAILVIAGLYTIFAKRKILWGIVLIIVGFLVGPGGVSIFNP
jgi:hypothetical protein